MIRKSTLSKLIWTVTMTVTAAGAGWVLYALTSEAIKEAPGLPRALMAVLMSAPIAVYGWALSQVVVVDGDCLNYTNSQYWLEFGKTICWLAFSFVGAYGLIALTHVLI